MQHKKEGTRRQTAKVAAVALAVGTLMLSVADMVWPLSLRRWALNPAAEGFLPVVTGHLCYPFLHAHPLHALVNGRVLLQIAFRTPMRLRHLLLAYAIACCCPAAWAAWPQGGSVVGLSGVVYALLGMWMPHVARRLRYNLIVALWLTLGWLMGTQAVTLHLFCYAAGVLWVSQRVGAVTEEQSFSKTQRPRR